MSRAGTDDDEPQHHHQQGVEDDADCFHDSFDRILSSSNSSTSASEDDDVVFASPRHHRHCSTTTTAATAAKRSPKFPISVASYDAWISDSAFSSSSLQQRRDRLLRALGLSSDAVLSRRKPSLSNSNASDFSRSDSSERLAASADTRISKIHPDSSNSPIPRSKYDGECQIPCRPAPPNHDHLYNSPLSVSDIDTVNSATAGGMNSNVHVQDVDVDNLARDWSSIPLAVSNNSSLGNDEIHSDPARSDPTLRSDDLKDDGGSSGEEAECTGTEDANAEMCTIKNLDTGKEFVVNEVREDGMWNKLREVGTGRQMTMEEFDICVGHSPIVQELMRRQSVEDQANDKSDANGNGNGESGTRSKKKVSWFKSIKNVASSVAGHKERRSSDERDTSSEKGGRRSSSATDDSQDNSFHGPEKVRVRQYGKSVKELTAVYKSQEIQGHNGSIWSIKFSLDGRYLASAGEDCVIHVWQVVESERKGELLIDRPDDVSLSLLFLTHGSPEPNSLSPSLGSPLDRKRRGTGRTSVSRKSVSLDHILIPETVFGLSDKPFCSLQGHLDDVLDLSWSKSQLLLSSSMDKTVRLWNLSSRSCLQIFSHSDYVTCIQFNPADDRYFISGSLDAKVRIWSIPDRQVVDWNDLHEMVTAACYTSDGQGALVGTYKGSCCLYNTSENKLHRKSQINLQNKKKKGHLKKITGFQFAPGSSSEVLITSADSRVRVVDGVDIVHKFKGFRNTNSQISASITSNSNYVVCASEDSHVYVWKHEGDSRPGRSKGITVTRSYEHFHSQDVSVAIPWPGIDSWGANDPYSRNEPQGAYPGLLDEALTNNHPPTPVEGIGESSGVEGSPSASGCSSSSPFHGTISSATNSYFFDRIMTTWPEEKPPLATKNPSPRHSLDFSNGVIQNRSAWGMVIVTAGLRGEIRTYQNFGLPFRI